MTLRDAFASLDSDQLSRASGGITWPWDPGFKWPWQQQQQQSQPSFGNGGVNKCENPKHIPPMGAQVPTIGGPTVTLPVFPCVNIKQKP